MKLVLGFFLVSLSLAAIGEAPSARALSQMISSNKVVIVVDASVQGTRPTSQTLKLYENGRKTLYVPVTTGPHTREVSRCETSAPRSFVGSWVSMGFDDGRTCVSAGERPYLTGTRKVKELRGDFYSNYLHAQLNNLIQVGNNREVFLYFAPNSRRTLGIQGNRTGGVGMSETSSEEVYQAITRAGVENAVVHIHL